MVWFNPAMTDALHRRLLNAAFAAAFVLGAFLALRASGFLPLYLDPKAREGFAAAMTSLRADTGWGASAFDVRAVACDKASCEATIDFRYRSNPAARRTELGWTLRWPKDDPNAYALER